MRAGLYIIIPEYSFLSADTAKTKSHPEGEKVRGAMLQPVKASQIPKEQRLFTEAWNILKAYHDIEVCGCDREWKEVVDRLNNIFKESKGSPHTEKLGEGLVMAVLNYLEEISKEAEGAGDLKSLPA